MPAERRENLQRFLLEVTNQQTSSPNWDKSVDLPAREAIVFLYGSVGAVPSTDICPGATDDAEFTGGGSDMATLTPDETTRSTRIDSVSRLSLSAARDAVIALRRAQDSVSGRRRAVLQGVPGAQYALAAPCGPSNGLSQPDIRLAAAINQSKSIKSTTDEGRTAVDHNGMGAFVTSLGSRPPSPPV